MAPGHGNGGEGVERGEGAMRSALAHVKDSYPAFEGEGLTADGMILKHTDKA